MKDEQRASHRRQLSEASTLTPSVPSTRRTSATSLLTHVDGTPFTTAPPSSAYLSGPAAAGARESDHQPQIPRLSQLKGHPYAGHRWNMPNPRFDWTTPPYGAGPGSDGCETWAENMTDWLEAYCGEHGINTGGKTDWLKSETEQGRGITSKRVGDGTEYSKGPLYPDVTSDKFNRLEHNVFLCLQRNAGESSEDWRTRLEPLSSAGNENVPSVSVDLESIEQASGIHQDV